MPVVFLLLFVYVFGGTLGAGLGGAAGGRAAYVNYVAPGILLMTVAAAAQATAISVAMDMTEGIIARFRTMADLPRLGADRPRRRQRDPDACSASPSSSASRCSIGFRPTASPAAWLAAVGLLALFTFALTWLSVALGLVSQEPSRPPATCPMFLAAAAVPRQRLRPHRLDADRRCAGSPSTSRSRPIIETLRGLLLGTPIGNNAIIAVAWCAGIALVGYLWAKKLFNRDPVR